MFIGFTYAFKTNNKENKIKKLKTRKGKEEAETINFSSPCLATMLALILKQFNGSTKIHTAGKTRKDKQRDSF